MVWLLPKQIHKGKYTLERQLGEGRFSITYLAKDAKGDRLVIKTPTDQPLSPADFNRLQQNFVKEAFKLAKCQHPHIVKLLEDPFQEDGFWCIALEYIPGVDLSRRDKNILPEPEALNYIQQIGEALKIVHAHNLVHRDVKPANIMIRAGSQQAMLIDFGLTRRFDSKTLSVNNVELEAEEGFTPPELYSQVVELGAYTDIYSLAATLYHLLTGQIPISAKDRLQNEIPLPAPKDLNHQISQNVSDKILWAMDLDIKKRPQSIQEWFDGLNLKPLIKPKRTKPKPDYEKYHVWIGIISLIIAIIAIITRIFDNEIREFILQLLPQNPPTNTHQNPPKN